MPEGFSINIAEALGAEPAVSAQKLTLYLPDQDREGVEIGTQRRYVLEAAQLLARIGGGVTILPPVEGGWRNPQTGVIVWERPVLVYTYINQEAFLQLLPELRRFVHRVGRETRQGEIAIELDGSFYRIHHFETEGEE